MIPIEDDPMIVVVHPVNDIDELEAQWNKYQQLRIQYMQHSDDRAIALYGMPNRTIYERMKAYLLTDLNDYNYKIDTENNTIKESTEDTIISDDDLIKKVERAIELNNDYNVIIYPPTPEYPYTIEDLNDMFNRYNMLSQDLKTISDGECESLFGTNNLNMYNKCKNTLQELIDQVPEIFDHDNLQESDTSFNNYFRSLDNITGLNNLLEKKFELLVLKDNGSLLESTFAEDSIARIDDSINKERELSDCVPEFVPSLIPTEIEEIVGEELTEDDYKFLNKLKMEFASGLANFDSEKYYNELKEASQIDNQSYNINMIKRGWNPNIPLNENGFKYAQNRMKKYISEYYNINIVDMRNKNVSLDEDLKHNIDFKFKPIFLVSGYDDCYISTDVELMWLYNEEKDPISIAIIDEFAPMNVFCVFVDESIFVEFKKHINDGEKNTELFNALRSNIGDIKRLCSTFVNVVASLSNMDRSNDPIVYYIFRGEKQYYTADFAIPVLNTILTNTSGLLMRKMSPSDALNKIIDNKSVVNYKAIRCNESEANDTLNDIKYLYTARSVIVESRKESIKNKPEDYKYSGTAVKVVIKK